VRKFLTLSDPVLPMHHPSLLVQEAVAQGANETELLSATGVTPAMLTNGEARISYEQFNALIRNALSLTGNVALGVDFGRRIHLSHLGVLGLLVMSSSTVGESFEAGLRYYKALAPGWDLALDVDGRFAVLTAQEVVCREPFHVFATETLLMAVEGFARHLLPEYERAVHEVRLSFPEPEYSHVYRKVFNPRLVFDSAETRVLLDANLLGAPLASADRITATWAERQCAAQFSNVACHQGLIAQVRALLCAAPGAYPDVDKVARILQTSARSLRRSLREMNTSYLELLDDARRVHAIEYVAATDLPCERIASDLSFSDARSFRRAFRRWTGVSPSEYRAPRRAANSSSAG
jgi:AraC-like DNA-binding protein